MTIKKLMVSKNILFMKVQLKYYLTMDEVVCDDSTINTYGVEIQKIEIDEFGVEHAQKSTAADICLNENRVFEFIRLLSDNDAMPVSLMDIVRDKIEEGFFEPNYENCFCNA